MLSVASITNNVKLLNRIKLSGVDLSTHGNLPMCMACFYGSLDVVDYLHNNGVSINSDNIQIAKNNNHDDVVNFLISKIEQNVN